MDLASEDTGALSYVRRKAGAGVVSAGYIETDLLPKDKAREAFLRVAGELLPVFRCINTLQPNLYLPITRNEKRQAVPITHAHDTARDRLPHGGVSEGHDPEEQRQPEAGELEWGRNHFGTSHRFRPRFERFRAACRTQDPRPK